MCVSVAISFSSLCSSSFCSLYHAILPSLSKSLYIFVYLSSSFFSFFCSFYETSSPLESVMGRPVDSSNALYFLTYSLCDELSAESICSSLPLFLTSCTLPSSSFAVYLACYCCACLFTKYSFGAMRYFYHLLITFRSFSAWLVNLRNLSLSCCALRAASSYRKSAGSSRFHVVGPAGLSYKRIPAWISFSSRSASHNGRNEALTLSLCLASSRIASRNLTRASTT